MKNRKYPVALFVLGFLGNLFFRYSFFLVIAVLLFIIRIFVSSMPVMIPISIIILWVLFAFTEQCILRKTALEDEHEVFDKIFNADSERNWKDNVLYFVESESNGQQNAEEKQEIKP